MDLGDGMQLNWWNRKKARSKGRRELQVLGEELRGEASRRGMTLDQVLRERIDKMGIKIAPDEELEEAEYAVCMRDGEGEYFRDDLRTTCSMCGARIHHRPHVPKKPKKICIYCLEKVQKDEEAAEKAAKEEQEATEPPGSREPVDEA